MLIKNRFFLYVTLFILSSPFYISLHAEEQKNNLGGFSQKVINTISNKVKNLEAPKNDESKEKEIVKIPPPSHAQEGIKRNPIPTPKEIKLSTKYADQNLKTKKSSSKKQQTPAGKGVETFYNNKESSAGKFQQQYEENPHAVTEHFKRASSVSTTNESQKIRKEAPPESTSPQNSKEQQEKENYLKQFMNK